MQKKFSRKHKTSKRSKNNKTQKTQQYGGAGLATTALRSATQPETIKALAELFPNITTIMKGVGDGFMNVLKNHLEVAKSIKDINLKTPDPEHLKKLSEFFGKKLGGVFLLYATKGDEIIEKLDPVFEKMENAIGNKVTRAQNFNQRLTLKRGILGPGDFENYKLFD